MEQFADALAAMRRALDGLTDALAGLPSGAIVTAVAFVAAGAGAILGLAVAGRRSRRALEADIKARMPSPAPASELVALPGSSPDPLPIPSVAGAEARAMPVPPPEPLPPPPPTPEQLALASFRKALEAKGIAGPQLDAQAREFGRLFAEIKRRLGDLVPGDPALTEMAAEAREALDEGALDQVIEQLDSLAKQDGETGLAIRGKAELHLVSAATAHMIAGDLQLALMAPDAAEATFREAVTLVPRANEDLRAEVLNKHGTAAYQKGDVKGALESFKEALGLLERKLGTDHPDVATALNNLALIYYTQGDYESAEPLYRRALRVDEKALGPDHASVATDLNNLGLLFKKQGKLEEAEPLLRRALTIKEQVFPPGHPSLVTGLRNYASILRALGRTEQADAYESRAGQSGPRRIRAARRKAAQ